MELDYNILIERAMRDVVKFALKKVQKIHDRNFCFMFIVNTKNKRVRLPDFVKKQYPEEITLILQHQFSNLNVKNTSFSVDLSFNGKIENVIIPFDSINVFSDQIAGIELRFNFSDEDIDAFDDYDDDYEETQPKTEANNNADYSNNLIKFSDLKR
jgi:hypothetical protein